ncbi:MAG TPA: hypothetical protein VKB42_06655 [Dongiaceae bacterium]|nr:hypothetical protein [Dongiaceae bacterium]
MLLTYARLPKSATTEAGADRRRRAAAVQELIALLRHPDKRIWERERDMQRILRFLREEGLSIVLADDPFKALRLFLGLPGRGHREQPPWRDHDIAVAVEERVAGGLTVERAVEQVAETTRPRLSVRRVRRIYYDHRRAARAELAERQLKKG